MEIVSLTAQELKTYIIAGANNLQKHKAYVDQLNVFPVPDGDTGTNMSLTILSAAREVEKVNSDNIFEVAKAASSGALRGARGNSGVILSQLFRGFAKGLENQSEVTTKNLAVAFAKASETAYKAVMKPKEGTILTVARGLAEKAVEAAPETDNIVDFLKEVIAYGNEVLDKTPDMLPVLKQAGVVDAGGKGLLVVLEGAFSALIGEETVSTVIAPAQPSPSVANVFAEFKTEDITFGYCTEFIINTKEVNQTVLGNLTNYLEGIGDSIVVVGDDDLIKIHVHTDHPGQALEKALSIGPLSNMKIENMREQHSHNLVQYDGSSYSANNESQSKETNAKPVEEKEYGFIAVAAGDGLANIFTDLGVDVVIQGGQTMNPSTEDFLNAIDSIPAKHVFIFPNNSNIILAAQQAQEISAKDVYVIPSKTLPQGITAMIQMDHESEAKDNFDTMVEALNHVKTGQVTFAVRDTVIDDIEIHTNDIMGIQESKISVVTKEVKDTTTQLLSKMVDEDSEIVSIFYGEDVSQEEAEELLAFAQKEYSHCDVELHRGGQPLYYYILSVE